MENIVKLFFDSLTTKNKSIIEKYFSKNVVYSESFCNKYNGKNEVIKHFFDVNNNGNSVQKWQIKRIIRDKKTIVAEWYFEGIINISKIEIDKYNISYNGISIFDFDENDKIEYIKDYWRY